MDKSGQSAADSGGVRLIQGIAILGAAAVISKLLGTLQKIPLQNLAGDEAYGIYSAVYPFYVLLLFLATAGFPTAVSKLVSEQTAMGNWQEARRIYRLSSMILTFTGMAAFVFTYFGAGVIAGWIGSAQAEQAIRSVSFALLIVPFMASTRGYFQGMQNMVPTAVSQVAEQTIRVAVMIALLLILTNQEASSGMIAAGATFGSVAGAAAGLAVMMLYDLRERSRLKDKDRARNEADNDVSDRSDRSGMSGRSGMSDGSAMINKNGLSDGSPVGDRDVAAPAGVLVRRIVKHALPVALGSIVVPIVSMIDSFTLPRLIAGSYGLTEREALHQFGVYARGLPLVQLVAMLFSSLSAALVPALSNARTHGDETLIRRRAELSLRLTWLIGLAASVGLAAVSLPVNIMLYTDDSGTLAMAVMAWTALFSSLNVVTAALLQGIGMEKLPALHLLLAAAIKITMNILLIPYLGIAGAAWSGVVAYAAASLLNLRAVTVHTGLNWPYIDYLKRASAALIAMLAAIIVLYGGFAGLTSMLDIDASDRLWNTVQALVMVSIGSVVFFTAALRSGALREAELKLLPGIYRRIAPPLRKWRILRTQDTESFDNN